MSARVYRVMTETEMRTATGASAAEEMAAEWAREIAGATGDDLETIELYGGPDESDNWGACPDGQSGAYYPMIRS